MAASARNRASGVPSTRERGRRRWLCLPSDRCPASSRLPRSRAAARPRPAGSRRMGLVRYQAIAIGRRSAQFELPAASATESSVDCMRPAQPFRWSRKACAVFARTAHAGQTRQTRGGRHRPNRPGGDRRPLARPVRAMRRRVERPWKRREQAVGARTNPPFCFQRAATPAGLPSRKRSAPELADPGPARLSRPAAARRPAGATAVGASLLARPRPS